MVPCSFCVFCHNNEMSHLGRTVQNKPNLGEPDRIPKGRLCKTNPIPGGAAWDRAWGTRDYCAKRSQFRGVRLGPEGETCKTKPISPVGQGLREQNAQNEPNFAPAPGNGRGRGQEALPGTNCAKQTQSGPAWAGPSPRWAKDAKRTQSSAGCRCHKRAQHPHAIVLGRARFDWSLSPFRAIMATSRLALPNRNLKKV